MELPMGGVVNLGIGMPEAVAAVALEERILDQVTLTAEPGRHRSRDQSTLRALVTGKYPARVQQDRDQLFPLVVRCVDRDGVLTPMLGAANHEQ